MADHSSPLQSDGEDLLQAALSDAFSISDLPRESAVTQTSYSQDSEPKSEAVAESAEGTEGASPPPASAEQHDAWKAEYEANVAQWRRQSAEARERSEAERARWEEVRAREREEARLRPPPEVKEKVESESGWESVSGITESTGHHSVLPGASSARTNIGIQTQHAPENTTPPSNANDSHPSSSAHWDDFPSSMTSSFPSMSFPEASRSHSPEHHHRHPADQTHHVHDSHAPAHTPHSHTRAHEHASASASTTLAVFDGTLSVRTRAWALVSSLTINMFLPFVNGVMLGFGEIFARNVVGWLGWRVPGAAAANVGIRPLADQRKKRAD
ncbi:hypothetical protein HETIRDRAFT_426508 [Heterobasidion irregulare TC 32-1]|uniref:Uncharacterized protein n=1 Tax=Heterobasidion irregulare (strain TC 32-1) TaxID=747525 RepID=W4KDD3_HETIT|nr:uncharacterized protein HETIRDRAFT_426508 [Heterobasidion irregulare TC 32-1]ETW83101.1 hypothetical protein HETIRDRAFT_426508 [Heterobasidion irregulare TC 32-1]